MSTPQIVTATTNGLGVSMKTSNSTPALRLDGVSRTYDGESAAGRAALRDVTLAVEPGRRVAVVGRSGSGKSTLLHLAAGIDLPTTGSVELFGRDLSKLTDRERTHLRRNEIGLVFQSFHLQAHLSVAENVALPDAIAGAPRRPTAERVRELLDRVGLGDRAGDVPEKLSGGEQQRVALCRALLRRPRLLLADEPTGSLDEESGQRVMALMLELVEEHDSTLVFVTHSRELAATADQILTLRDGRLCEPT